MAMTDEQKMEWLAKIMGSGKMSVGQFIMDNHGTMTINNNMGDSHEGEQPQGEVCGSEQIAMGLRSVKYMLWGNAAYSVPFCVCRDVFGWDDNVSNFERKMAEQGIIFPEGTIYTAMSRNPYLKLHIDKWEENGAMERALKLRDEFRQQVLSIMTKNKEKEL
jgi:hypothetical protein